jgi:hypothetical protein
MRTVADAAVTASVAGVSTAITDTRPPSATEAFFQKTDAARRTHGTGRRVRESHARQMPFVSVMTVKNEVYC